LLVKKLRPDGIFIFLHYSIFELKTRLSGRQGECLDIDRGQKRPMKKIIQNNLCGKTYLREIIVFKVSDWAKIKKENLN
jgi:hypothetical protein